MITSPQFWDRDVVTEDPHRRQQDQNEYDDTHPKNQLLNLRRDGCESPDDENDHADDQAKEKVL